MSRAFKVEIKNFTCALKVGMAERWWSDMWWSFTTNFATISCHVQKYLSKTFIFLEIFSNLAFFIIITHVFFKCKTIIVKQVLRGLFLPSEKVVLGGTLPKWKTCYGRPHPKAKWKTTLDPKRTCVTLFQFSQEY